MTPTLFETPSGHLSVRIGGESLEDPRDPVHAASMFVDRSQIERADHVVVLGVGLGYRLRHLAFVGCEHPIVYEPCPELLGLARTSGVGIPAGARVFTDLRELQQHLLSVTRPKENTILLAPPAYRRAFEAEHDALGKVLSEVQGLVLLARNSVMERAAMLAERAIANVGRLDRVPTLGRVGRALEGTPAFIVSAGPSLDANRAWLGEASRRGAVFAVNTSAPVFAHLDVPIDLLVAIEALDVTEPIALASKVARALALDLTSGSANFDAAIERKMTFLVDSPPFRPLAEALGIDTLGYGGSVATAAFAIAAALGADPIVLVGQDLAYTDGRGYASDTLYESTRVYRDGELLYIDRSAKWDETTAKGGLKVPGKLRPVVDVPRWGGGEPVWSTHELVSFRRWFEMAAEVLDGRVRLVNATEGGARVAGFEELGLEELVRSLPVREHGLHAAIDAAARVDRDRIARTRAAVANGSVKLGAAAQRALKALRRRDTRALSRAEDEVRRAAAIARLAESHAGSELLAIMDDEALDPGERARRTYGAIHRSAARIGELARRAA
ncbi:MAG: 6-hydroxymethylpterin diphosphokinase MptE-like protein [Sandaracinaceae bacterium]